MDNKNNNKYYDTNKARWDELAELHFEDSDYDVKGFLEGNTSLMDLEIKDMGDVKGKKLLHLQCHFGMDTLSWARLGAEVTGVDFSEKGIANAKKLAELSNLDGKFVASNIMDLEENLDGKSSYDIVFTSYGVLGWLSDMKRWAEVIAFYLKPGGKFYIAETHPVGGIFDDEDENVLKPRYNYFYSSEPEYGEYGNSYAIGDRQLKNKGEYWWSHTVSDIINSLIDAGLKIEFFREYPYLCWKMLPFLEKRGKLHYMPDKYPQIPMTFTIQAVKE